MGEKDLVGFDDCDSRFTEADTATLEHVRHSAYWAVSTDRGQDWEEPNRWLDLFSQLEQRGTAAAPSVAATAGTDLEETDARVVRAVYTIEPGETSRWKAQITTASGVALVEGALQTLPQDIEAEDEPVLPDPGPVAPGGKTIRQGAIDKGWFPSWLLGPNSGRIVYSFALVMDMAAEWLVQGIQQRLPLVCDDGALPYLSRDLGIRKGFRETRAAFRQRLRLWIPTWRRAGTPFSIAEQVQAYFSPQSPRVHVVQHDPGADGKPTRATWSTRNPDGSEETHVESPSNFDWDSDDATRPASLDTRDPRIAVIVEQPAAGVDGEDGLFAERTSAQAVARDDTAMNGCTRPDGSAAPADQYRDLFNMAEEWRAMGTFVSWILVYLGEVDTGGTGADYPDGRWFDPLNDALDGNRIPQTWRLLYVNRYNDDRLPESPEPYEV